MSGVVVKINDSLMRFVDGIERDFQYGIRRVLERCKEKNGGYVRVSFHSPKKARTLPQNSKFHAMCQELAVYTGNDMEDVKMAVKEQAVSRGYPAVVNSINGKVYPKSSAAVDTVAMNILMETLYQIGAEFGYVFKS